MKKALDKLTTVYRLLYPRLTVLVSCGTIERPNALTIAWSSPLSADPPLLGISISPKRLSHEIILKNKDFVVNIPQYKEKHINSCYYLGRVSGREEPDKIIKSGLSIEPSEKVQSPRIKDFGINLECELVNVITTGDHDLFIGKILYAAVDPAILDDWGVSTDKFKPIYWRQSKYKNDVFTLNIIN